MDKNNEQPDIFFIRRKTPRARGLSWGGTIFFGVGLLTSGYYWLLTQRYTNMSEVTMFRFCIFIALFFICAILMWVASSKAQNGTISISDERISCKCERTFLDIMPGQVSSVTRYDNLVKIVFCGKTLTIRSEKASQIEDRVKDFISAYKYSGNLVNSVPVPVAVPKAESKNVQLSSDKIREYKKLVDDGIITQEQFDKIIDKLTQK